MKSFIFLFLILFVITGVGNSQGCVAVRTIAGFGQYNLTDNAFSTSDWQLNITNRYFKSFRDFKGNTDQKTSSDSMNINHSYSLDISMIRLMGNGWSLSLNLPLASNSRSSKTEHGGLSAPRHATHSFGIGDIRITLNKWLLTPRVNQKINIQLGLGLKLPTGDYKYQDYFYRKEDSLVLAPVNPSIQLGDGGTGIISELNTFYILSNKITFYGNFFYLVNPREQNGTSNLLGKNPSSPSNIYLVKSGGDINSVPDQFSARVGAYFNFRNLSFSAGIRDEGVPVYDLIGGNNGSRRAGHNLSFEPGILYKLNKATLYAYVPVMIDRKVNQSIPDKKETLLSGKYTQRQGGFADYLIFVGASFKF